MTKESENKPYRLFYFRINDEETCIRAIDAGGWLAVFIGIVLGALGIAGLFSDMTDNLLLDPLHIYDSIVSICLGIFILRKSRLASTTMVVIKFFTTLYLLIVNPLDGQVVGVLAIVLLICYINAMRGTYIWHSKYRIAD